MTTPVLCNAHSHRKANAPMTRIAATLLLLLLGTTTADALECHYKYKTIGARTVQGVVQGIPVTLYKVEAGMTGSVVGFANFGASTDTFTILWDGVLPPAGACGECGQPHLGADPQSVFTPPVETGVLRSQLTGPFVECR